MQKNLEKFNNDEYENTKFEAKLIGKMADFIKRNMN